MSAILALSGAMERYEHYPGAMALCLWRYHKRGNMRHEQDIL
jgi:hypothetical protein